MKIETFGEFLKEILVPMFPGASIAKSTFIPVKRMSETVVYDHAPTRLRVRQSSTARRYFSITRLQKWDDDERLLVKRLISTFDRTRKTAPALLTQLEDFIVRTAIAQTVASGKQAETLVALLETLSAWASQTYEGERISCGIVVEPVASPNPAAVQLLDVMAEDFGKVLSDGVDSWWRVDHAGLVRSFRTINLAVPVTSEQGYFPLRYLRFAAQATSNAIAVTLNRNGEILIFAQGALRFAKRRGRWLHFSHEPVVTSMSWGRGSLAVRKAIYESCMDASFARTGGCIGVVQKRYLATFDSACPVSPDDRLDAATKLKPRTAGRLISGRVFQSIPRLVRKELLSLDGALVLRWDGTVLAAGAIVDLNGVRRGNQGGRSAAARALGAFGVAIKVSEDGLISGYKPDTPEDGAAFKIG